MPATVVFEGEHTEAAARVPTASVDNCKERRGEQRAQSKTMSKASGILPEKNNTLRLQTRLLDRFFKHLASGEAPTQTLLIRSLT